MAENLKTVGFSGDQVQQFLRSLSVKQRLLLAGSALLVAGLLYLFVRMMSTPEMKPLYTGMTPEDGQQLVSRLTAENIRSQLSPDGTSVSVSGDQLDEARLTTATKGMPRSGRLGFELFDKPNWGGSDFSEKVNYQRALEGELERTIQSLRDVEAVRVHLVVPRESVFVDHERPAKASVTLRLRGARLNPEAQTAIANLVAGAVDRLSPANVAVIDAETNRPLVADEEESGSSGKLDDRLERKLVETLEPVVGAGRVRASVHVERDLTSADETQETYDPNSAVALTMQRNEERSGGPIAGGIPGTASNVPSGSAAVSKAVLDESSQSSKSESGTYAVNRLVKHTVFPAGRVRKITAGVLVDDALAAAGQPNGGESRRKRTPEELKQFEEIARATLGLDSARGDTISVQNLSFEAVPVETPAAPNLQQRVRTVTQQWSSVLRYSGILLLFVICYFLFLRPVKRQLLTALKEVAPGHRLGAAKPLMESQPALDAESELVRLKRQTLEKAKAEPASTSRLLQNWLREEGKA